MVTEYLCYHIKSYEREDSRKLSEILPNMTVVQTGDLPFVDGFIPYKISELCVCQLCNTQFGQGQTSRFIIIGCN